MSCFILFGIKMACASFNPTRGILTTCGSVLGAAMPGGCMGAPSHPADFPKSAPVPFSSFWLLPNCPSLNSHLGWMPPTLVPVLSPLCAPHIAHLSFGIFLVGQSFSLASRSVFHRRDACGPLHAPLLCRVAWTGWVNLPDSGGQPTGQ